MTKAAAMLRVLFLPRDFDREHHLGQLRQLKEARVFNKSAFRQFRRALGSIDVVGPLDDVAKVIKPVPGDDGSGR